MNKLRVLPSPRREAEAAAYYAIIHEFLVGIQECSGKTEQELQTMANIPVTGARVSIPSPNALLRTFSSSFLPGTSKVHRRRSDAQFNNNQSSVQSTFSTIPSTFSAVPAIGVSPLQTHCTTVEFHMDENEDIPETTTKTSPLRILPPTEETTPSTATTPTDLIDAISPNPNMKSPRQRPTTIVPTPDSTGAMLRARSKSPTIQLSNITHIKLRRSTSPLALSAETEEAMNDPRALQ